MFITNMVMSIAMFVLLFITAPIIAQFFGREELTDLCRVMGVILIIQALSITQTTILTKQIDFKTKAKASLISAVSSGGLVLVWPIQALAFGHWLASKYREMQSTL